MAWTAPRTWATGETITAALLNTHVRDNELSLRGMHDKAVYVLLDATDVTIANSTVEPGTVVPWQAAWWNIGGMWSSAANPSRITPGEVGYYSAAGIVVLADNTSGTRAGALWRDGTTNAKSIFKVAGLDAGMLNQTIPWHWELFVSATTQYWELYLRQNTGAALDLRSRTIPGLTQMTFRLLGST